MTVSKAPLNKQAGAEPDIAIVGMAFRLPGARAEALWPALLAGTDLVSAVEVSRWAQETFLHPRKSEPGTAYTFAAGSIGDVSGFDAAFFGISPREAAQMDPQQRVLLELAWEAFEHAGIAPQSMRESHCGVYVGISSLDYGYRRADDFAAVDATTMTGNTASIAANRLSYFFDLRGPSMAVDTACSSSLVALHQACVSIRNGESSAALVGGISLHLHPLGFIGFSKASMLSRRGRCNVFDASGDGYVRSEGGAVLLLKRLDDALADGNRVLAVVAGSGINCDGKTNGLTVPSADAQAALLRDVYARARIAPDAIDYVEIHGTGTAVGDPIETRALGEALGLQRAADRPLPIGSVKSNLGHLEAAAGMAGLVKALLSIEHRCVPATIGVRELNPNIRFGDWHLAPVTCNMTLPGDRPPVIGINSFGFGGSNAHAVLKGYAQPRPAQPPECVTPAAAAPPPLLLSARSPAALQAMARAMAWHLRERVDQLYHDIAYSAVHHRELHSHRLVVAGAARETVAATLEAFADGRDAPLLVTATARPAASAPVFVYAGNGSQWMGMGAHLLAQDPVFRSAVEEVDALLAPRAGYSIVEQLQPAQCRLDLTEIAQPTLFAVQVGLTRMLRHRGVVPAAVVGHSVGEVAAAWASGALTLAQAVAVIHARSHHQGHTKGLGQMTAVALPEAEARALLERLQLSRLLVVAGINGPRGVTLSGEVSALERFEQAAAAASVTFKRLDLDYPFHGPAMDGVAEGLQRALAGLRPSAGEVPFWSTVSGSHICGRQLNAGYWWRNVREPVQFHKAIAGLIRRGLTSFVEIGPHPVLRAYLGDCLREAAADGLVVPTMLRTDADARQIERIVHTLVASGVPVAMGHVFPVSGEFVALPHYPWQRETHWHPATPEAGGLIHRRKQHPLLGYRLSHDTDVWENHLDTAAQPIYADHVVGGAVVFPAAGFVDMALAAAKAWRAELTWDIEGLEIHAPLLLAADHSKTVQLAVAAPDGRFTIRSRDRLSDGAWVTNVVGRFVEQAAPPHDAKRLRWPDGPALIATDEHYARAQAAGLTYGPAFRSVVRAWIDGNCVVGEMSLPAAATAGADAALLHPSTLDGCLQLLLNLLPGDQAADETIAFVPVRIEQLQLLQPGGRVAMARATLRHRGARSVLADFSLHDPEGRPVALLRNVRLRALQHRKACARPPQHLLECAAWAPRGAHAATAVLPSFDAMLAVCIGHLHASARVQARRQWLGEVEPLLDVLCAAFARRALLGLADTEGTLDPAALIATGRVAARAQPLLLRLLAMLEEDGLMKRAAQRWRWSAQPDLPAPEDIWNRLIGDYPQCVQTLAAVGHSGLHLCDALAGHARAEAADHAAIQTMLPRTGAALEDTFAGLIQHATAHQPAGRRLRVLIVHTCRPEGAAGVAPAVDADRCDLVVAAQSAALMSDLQGLAHTPADIDWRELDLDRPGAGSPAELGGRFDLVLLPGGLSSHDDADQVLQNLRELLLAGGALLVVEAQPARVHDIVFGDSARWWMGGSDETAPRSRLHSPQHWQDLLQRHGFVGTDPLADLPDLAAGAAGVVLLLASAPGVVAEPALSSPAPACWLITQDASGESAQLAEQLAQHLAAASQQTVRVSAGQDFHVEATGDVAQLDPHDPVHWRRLIEHCGTAHELPVRWVHLQGLGPQDRPLDPLALLQQQQSRMLTFAAWLQACAADGTGPDSWVVTRGGAAAELPGSDRNATALSSNALRDAALWGLARVAMQEYAKMRIRCVDLADLDGPAEAAMQLAHELLAPDAEDEILLTRAGRFAPRLHVAPDRAATTAGRDATTACLVFSTPGSLKNLQWQRRAMPAPGPGEVEIAVRAAGLNFRDVMFTMGLLPDEALEGGFSGDTLGMELSGIVTATGEGVTGVAVGDAVVAFAPSAFGARVVTQASAVQPKPAQWSFDAAATVPTAFLTAHYALHELARVRAGERLLIHGAAGGVGMAALQLAKAHGMEIFATAGTDEKRDVIRLLGADHVLDSRSLAFADQILALTGGEGVDVVLNSLAGEAINRNLRILKPFGRFLELGKRDFYEDTRIGLRPMRNNISYFGIDADQLMAWRPDVARRVFASLMALFAQGTLRPLPHRVFDARDAAEAFRHMLHSQHIGKIVLSFPPGFDPPAQEHASPPPLALRGDATYLVTGGLSGFGLRTARWLAHQGARHLVLLGRRGADSPEARAALAEFECEGVSVAAVACDVTDRPALAALFERIARELPPLRGVVHAAMAIDDGLIRNLTAAQMGTVLEPKVLGALYLDELTRALPQASPLDFFVLYSSATTLFGNPGQGSYVAANMALQALAAARRANGLAATCIAWGPIDDAGYLARHAQVKDALLSRMGGAALKADDALVELARVLGGDAPEGAVMDLDWSTLCRHLPAAAAPKFSALARRGGKPATGGTGTQDLRRRLDALPTAELESALVDILRQAIGEILRIAPDKLDVERSVYDMGMDSMMGVELVTALEERIGISLPLMALSEGPTIARLARRISQQIRPAADAGDLHDTPSLVPAAGVGVQQQVQRIAQQHASEVSARDVDEFSVDFAAARRDALPLVPEAVAEVAPQVEP